MPCALLRSGKSEAWNDTLDGPVSDFEKTLGVRRKGGRLHHPERCSARWLADGALRRVQIPTSRDCRESERS